MNNHQIVCCLNPQCAKPDNSITVNFCTHCGTPIVKALRQRYRPIKLLSDQGGFGRTYLAEDTDKLNQLCVIKQFAPQVTGSSALKKAQELFEQEALQLQQVGEHPQIPSLLAYFKEDNCLYIIQQYILGITLEDELNQRKKFYNEIEIRQFLGDILPVVKSIHDQNLIHRDIKPANIMRLSQNTLQLKAGRYVLIDFGASKDLGTTVVKTGTRIGTHGYSPKEQLLEGKAYPNSDLYSLGAVCFYLLTGIDPYTLFVDNGYGWVKNWRAHLSTSLSPELTDIISKLLEIDHQNRIKTAAEVIQYLTQKTAPATPQKRVTQPSATPPKTVTQPSATPQINGKLLRTLTGHQDEVASVAISSDGAALVSGSLDKTIKVWDLKTGKLPVTLTGHQDQVASVAISSDSATLVSGSKDKRIKIWDLKTGKLIRTLTGNQLSVRSVAISPDAATVVSGGLDQNIKIWDLKTGKLLRTLTGHQNRVRSIAISSDGATVVSGSWDQTIKIWDLHSGKLLRTLTGHQDGVMSVAISPDGVTVVSGSWDETIKVWDLKTGNLLRTLTGHQTTVTSVVISPDSATVVSAAWDKTVKIWNLKTGELLETLTGHRDGVKSLAISPDGATLVSGSDDKTIKIWQLR